MRHKARQNAEETRINQG